MLFIWILLGLLHLTYLILVGLFIYYWRQIPVFSYEKPHKESLVSVVVPVRNEAGNIVALLEDLQRQSFQLFEVLVVDDFSEDATWDLVKGFQEKAGYSLRLLKASSQNQGGLSRKKAALAAGIDAAEGELIVTTDGDCRVGPNWLRNIHALFQQKSPSFISGAVRLEGNGHFFQQLQVLEFASLVASGAASMQAGYPNMCNGANLAYPKTLFKEVGGFQGNEHIPSGDDEFLMHKIHRARCGPMLFLKDPESLVTTAVQPSLKAFLSQRKRWGSKWAHYQRLSPKLLALFIFAYHFMLVVLTLLTFGLLIPFAFWAWVMLTKVVAEWCFLAPILRFYGMGYWRKWIVPAAFIYSFYAVFVGISANFGHYQWKGRKL